MPEDKNKHLRSDEDSQLFRQFVGEVKTLQSNKEDIFDRKPRPKPIKKTFRSTLQPQLKPQSFDSVQSDEGLFFAKDGVQHKTIKRLKRGGIFIDDAIDLHGLTSQQAQRTLYDFLAMQITQKNRCLLVIHGKGTGSNNRLPVLKNLAFNLLKNEASVIALASAQQRDGGTGALYVLLKRAL